MLGLLLELNKLHQDSRVPSLGFESRFLHATQQVETKTFTWKKIIGLVQILLLSSEVDEVGSHAVLLAALQLVHAELGRHVLVGHLVPHTPPHVHHLRVQSQMVRRLARIIRADVGSYTVCVAFFFSNRMLAVKTTF